MWIIIKIFFIYIGVYICFALHNENLSRMLGIKSKKETKEDIEIQANAVSAFILTLAISGFVFIK